eukprot:GHVL01027415.1.p1 GENE.GHVL01027415.1~~GHVL01027415.1.p1  ORF type:complete len:164 (-),score=14.93 GHVL01027415.1:99-590(-)
MVEAAKSLGMPGPITIQNDFSLMDRRFEGELEETCAPSHCNLSLLPYGVLAGGALTGKYSNGAQPEKCRHTLFPTFQSRYHSSKALKTADRYVEVAKKAGLSPVHLALGFARSMDYIQSIIMGSTSVAQLEECMSAFEIELSEETLKQIDEIHFSTPNPFCFN